MSTEFDVDQVHICMDCMMSFKYINKSFGMEIGSKFLPKLYIKSG